VGNAVEPTSAEALAGLALHQLITAPRREQTQVGAPLRTSAQLFATLVAAHRALADSNPQAASLVSAWVREPGEDVFRILLGGKPGLPGVRPSHAENGLDAVLYPPGCLGRPLDPGHLGYLVARFPSWLRCMGETDTLWSVTDRDRLQSVQGSFAEYAAHVGMPFAWIIIAEPLPSASMEGERLKLTTDIPRLRQRVNSESDRVELERAESRYRELSRGRVTGMWNVHVLVGGMTPGDVNTVAALLCSATEIDRLPYILVPDINPGSFAQAWARSPTMDRAVSPFSGGSELLAALTAPPDVELPGIRLTDPNEFDVTPDDAPPDGLLLGTVLDRARESAGPLTVSRNTLNRHAFVCGATGSGKSQTTRWLLEQLSTASAPVPWLVIEPAKSEYARMAGRLSGRAEVLKIRPGDPDAQPASLNPLEPAPGFPLQSHLDLVRALFLAAFSADEPFPQVLAQALTQVYRESGWDLVTGEPWPKHKPTFRQNETRQRATPQYPTLNELQGAARRVVDQIGYGKEVTANVRGFVDVRIGGLCTGTPGRFFQGGHPLDIAALMERNVVFELEGITDDQDKAFLMGALIIRIVEHLRVLYGGTGCETLQHLTIIEEAHRLLKRVDEGPVAAAVELFASLLAEIRAYGEGITIVEQIPSKVIVDVVKNTALKIVHRLPAQDDRDAVGSTMNLTPGQSRAIVSLAPGTAAVALDGMDRPLLLKMRSGNDRESTHGLFVEPPLLGSRSSHCGSDCAATPCTLREMNEGVHQAEDPRTLLWTEAVTISILSGLLPPLGRDEQLAALNQLPIRLRDCTLSFAVDRSVSARRSALRRYFEPSDFSKILHEQLLSQVQRAVVTGIEQSARWQIGPRRYRDVQRVLMRHKSAEEAVSEELLRGWAERGLHLDMTDVDGLLQQTKTYANQQSPIGFLGDTAHSGLLDAIEHLAHGVNPAAVSFALRQSCAGITSGASSIINDRIAAVNGVS